MLPNVCLKKLNAKINRNFEVFTAAV